MANTIKKVGVAPNGQGRLLVNVNDVIINGDVIVDMMSPLQKQYGVFGKADLNTRNKAYNIRLDSTARIMQDGATCEPTPGTSVSASQSEVDPCPIKINEAWCKFNSGSSVVDGFIKYANNQIDESGYTEINTRFFNTLITQLVQSRYLLAAAGGLWGSTIPSTAFAGSATALQQSQFNAMKNLCTGWLKRFVTENVSVSSGNGGIVVGNFASSGAGAYDSTKLLTLYTTLVDGAALTKPNLVSFINMGAKFMSDGSYASPIAFVSNRLYQAAIKAYNTESSQAAQNERRFHRDNISTVDGRMQYIYRIDNTVLVPVDISEFDGLLTGKYEFMWITVTGNVAIYDSFVTEPIMDENGNVTGQAAFEIIDGKFMNKKGQTIIDGDLLMATVVGDLNLVTGMAAYIV